MRQLEAPYIQPRHIHSLHDIYYRLTNRNKYALAKWFFGASFSLLQVHVWDKPCNSRYFLIHVWNITCLLAVITVSVLLRDVLLSLGRSVTDLDTLGSRLTTTVASTGAWFINPLFIDPSVWLLLISGVLIKFAEGPTPLQIANQWRVKTQCWKSWASFNKKVVN